MSEPDLIAAARDQFCERVRGKQAIRARGDFDVDEYNHYVGETNALVNDWAGNGWARAILLPLLDHVDQTVRCSAASYLLRNEATDEALAVLEELAGRDELGRVALDADAVLLVWEKEQADRQV